MFRHIMIGIDGSPFALKAARYALELARRASAKVTFITVTPTWDSIALSEIASGGARETFDDRSKAYAARCLAEATAIAAELGVPCSTIHVIDDHPSSSILAAVDTQGCDLLVVGSHGRRGVERLVLGSQASRILTSSKVPVLVYRE